VGFREDKGGKYDLENRCRFLLYRTFKLAISKGWMQGANPVEIDRDFFITPDINNHHPTIKWEEDSKFLQSVELNPSNSRKQIVLATKLLLLTFLRTGALTRLEWDWIEEDEKDGKFL
jgi:integrase